ncbi:MAG: hypothetical protein WBA61_07340 [Aequorivita sp.]
MEDIHDIISKTIQNELKYQWLYILFSTVVGVVLAFIITYFRKKADNLATKQDIQQITDKIEAVKTEYSKQLEKFKGGQQLKSKRIEILYNLLIDLRKLSIEVSNISSPDKKPEFIKKTQELLTFMHSETLFAEKFKDEISLMVKEYNSWISEIERAKLENRSQYHITIVNVTNCLNELQIKLFDL